MTRNPVALERMSLMEALVLCLGDSNEDVREEAMVGLAKRKDRRVFAVLLAALEQPTMTDRVIEAAYMMLDMQNEREGWKARTTLRRCANSSPYDPEGDFRLRSDHTSC